MVLRFPQGVYVEVLQTEKVLHIYQSNLKKTDTKILLGILFKKRVYRLFL